jgi:hypothetical protein
MESRQQHSVEQTVIEASAALWWRKFLECSTSRAKAPWPLSMPRRTFSYECWAYKTGSSPFSRNAYRKRYLFITDQQELRYYEYPEAHF